MIPLRFVTPDLRHIDEAGSEVIVCGVWEDERPLTGLAALIDWRTLGRLSELLKREFILGTVGETLLVPVRPRLPYDKLLAYGLGARAQFGEATFRAVLAHIVTTLANLAVKSAVIELPGRGVDGGDERINAEQAAELLAEVLTEDARDTLCFVETTDGQHRIEAHVQARTTAARRTFLTLK